MQKLFFAAFKVVLVLLVLTLSGCADGLAPSTAENRKLACGFERPPYVARVRFHSLGVPSQEVSIFGLHAKPSRAYQELQMLSDVYRNNKTDRNILLGDFNADCNYLAPHEEDSLELKSLSWLISRGENTNTSNYSSCAYDRIVDDGAGLSSPAIDKGSASISDHYIVHAQLGGNFRIAALNLQRYGSQKAANSLVTGTARALIAKYDLIFLQEITSSSSWILDAITPDGYEYVASVGLGTTAYKERYVYMYRKDRVSMDSATTIDAKTNCN